MDPNQALKELREGLQELRGYNELDENEFDIDVYVGLAEAVAEKAEALDDWMGRGGFLPEDWAKGRK